MKIPPIVAVIRFHAAEHGWAIGVHGSLRRDIDLIAVPWITAAVRSDTLIHRIAKAIGYVVGGSENQRAHGRHTVLLIKPTARAERGQRANPKGTWHPAAIDLSIVDPRHFIGLRGGR